MRWTRQRRRARWSQGETTRECGQAHQAVIHRKNASSLMMMRANPKFDQKAAMIIASA